MGRFVKTAAVTLLVGAVSLWAAANPSRAVAEGDDVLIEVFETVGVSDGNVVRPQADIVLSESVGVADTMIVRRGAEINQSETIGVTDASRLGPARLIEVTVSVGAQDSQTALSGRNVAVNESI